MASYSSSSCVDRHVDADMGVVVEDHALGFHLRDAAEDDALLHLEVGNAVGEEPARLGELLVDVHLVAGAAQLLRAGEARRPRADHRHLLAGDPGRRLRLDPALLPRPVDDRAFDRLDGDRDLDEVERARRLARRRADAAGELGEIVGGMQVEDRVLPVVAIDEIVPVGDLVVHRAAGVTVRNAAVHAARRLVARRLFRQRNDELAPMADAIAGRRVAPVLTVDFEKAR